ncbi:MAG: hypothetical protein P8L42_10380 [Flavicella sp.]|nr:hypothetical protein [Flavicella sp.]
MRFTFIMLAWRNIWRNRKRAFLTISSIAASLFFVLFLRQMQFWTYDFNIKNTVSGSVGYLQITDSSYVDEKIIDNTLTSDQIDLNKIKEIEGVSGVYTKFQSGALVSTGLKSRFAAVNGINPLTDNKLLKLDRKLQKGTLLSPDDKAILITERMADYYKVSVGDTLVLMGQGYHGYTAAALYPIKGLLSFSVGDFSNMVFMPIKEAQYMHVAENRFTHVLIDLENSNDLPEVEKQIQKELKDPLLKLRTWMEVLPGLKQGLELDANSGLIISAILYMIVGFGIFGTIVMLYNERKFEFGVLSAIGTGRSSLIFITMTELFLLSSIGVLFGNLVAMPFLYYLNNNPIELGGEAAKAIIDQGFEPYLGTGMFLDVFLANSLAVLVIAAIASTYIIFKLIKINPIESMKQ